jgi:hypothetical protein
VTVPQPPPYGAPVPQSNNNTLGLIGMILGIASIPLACCFGAGFLFGAAGAVLGYLGKQKAAQGLATNGSQANVGFICGIVGVGLSLLWIIAITALNFSPNFF